MANWKPWVGNGFHFLFLFFAWVACLVAFGGELHVVSGGLPALSYYQDRLEDNGGTATWDSATCDVLNWPECKSCMSGGGGIVAMAFFAWFINMFHDILAVARVTGRESRIPKLNLDQLKCLKIELICAILEAVLLFFAIISWGPCYSDTNDNFKSRGWKVLTASGYGFIIFCFFPVAFGQIAFIVYCRRAPDQWRLLGTAPTGKTDNPAQPPAASAGQTSGPMDPAPQYVGPPQQQQYPPSQYPPQQYASAPPPVQYAPEDGSTGQEGVPR